MSESRTPPATKSPGVLAGVLFALRTSRVRPRRRGPDDVRAEGFGFSDIAPVFDDAGRRLVDLLRSLDPEDGSRPVPGMDWTVAETAAHTVAVLRRGLVDDRRVDSIDDVARLNAVTLAEIPERELAAVADVLEAHLAKFRQLLAVGRVLWRLRVGRWMSLELQAGLHADMATALAFPLCDQLVHADDIARACDRPTPIAPEAAAVGLRALLPALGPEVADGVLDGPRREVTFTCEGAEWALHVEVGGGSYSVRPAAREDAEAVLDPVATLLALMGRREADHPVGVRLASWLDTP